MQPTTLTTFLAWSRCVSTRLRPLVLVCASVLLAGNDAHAATRCLEDPSDAAQIQEARTAVDAACACFGFATHGMYVACAAGVVDARAGAGMLRNECKGAVRKIHAKSVCGSPVASKGAPVPCVSRTSGGKVSCAIRPSSACTAGPSIVRKPCYASTTCVDAGDTNGDLRISAPGDSGDCAAGSSFTDNLDGTITDDGTGLVWEKLSDDGSIHDHDAEYSWAGAAAVKVAALNGGGGFAGHTDWRVPTLAELQTLIRLGANPTIDAAFTTGCAPGCTVTQCSCTSPDRYWSSSTSSSDPQLAWLVYFDAGYALQNNSAFDGHVRAVRGGS